jgi:cobalamin biosynthetic protein CobC
VRILVNPNNPDGRTLASGQVREVAQRLQDADGWLIVDEAFADLDPAVSAAGEADCGNLVLLRSFGKFFGLAGLRLGFAVSTPPIAEEIAARLGPWPVSGPAIHVAVPALEDGSWQQEMRAKLHREAAALDEIMVKSGLAIVGGTALFRLVSHDKAGDNFERLLRERIFVRRFPDHPDWLRIGLPGSEQALRRFAGALRNAV